ncbi:MAG: T9SS type A sorting domain-containing protein [Candidatus Zixiibacteriota bacterium]|nr:MAG: T9SS type A sorting domain-containing protein [candidate division Zixibacteria bacterium]
MRRLLTMGAGLLLAAAVAVWAAVPTTLNDFFLPGSQPGQSGNIEHPSKCDNCHGGYDLAVEPAFNWRGSMMSQAARDPLFYACLAISNQDAPESGDLCIRCHSPDGWLGGRSLPTDGSALNANDREGVQCDFCHKLVKPTSLGVNPYPDDQMYTAGTYDADQAYLATLGQIPPTSANGMYIADANNAKRGPYVDAAARHQMFYSPFHKETALCGTCHDVSNPAFIKDVSGSYIPNDFDAPAPDFDPYTMFPIERTYSEWLKSEYNTPGGVFAPQFGGNKQFVSTCQDCHMRDVTGVGCNKKGAPTRSDLPLHDMTGGNTFIPALVSQLYPAEIDQAALDAGVQRATQMLQMAASLSTKVTPATAGYTASVTVTNETGHKLPSGYPEGRRIWLNVKAFDADGATVYESGAYDAAAGDLIHDPDIKVYEIKPGISEALAPALGLPAGPSFHFVLNHEIFKDNRIPPRGFTNANFAMIQSPPVNYTYPDGQNWDDTEYPIPSGATRVVATLYYQATSKGYVTFLRDMNTTNNWGQVFYDLWNTTGKSAPVAMNVDTFDIQPVIEQPPVADFVGTPTSGDAPLAVSFSDLSSNVPTSWSWDFGDANSSTVQNPTHIYDLPGVYTVSLTAANAFGSDTHTKTDYITATEVTITQMHVASIAVTRVAAGGPNRTGRATVTVVDQHDVPVAGAAVTGYFNAPNGSLKSENTDATGVAVVTSDKTKNPPADWCFTVTSVQLPGSVYDSSANLVTVACESGPAARFRDMAKTTTVPCQFGLHQNHPNPFNAGTVIGFSLPSASYVKLEVYNISGREVVTLVDTYLEAGNHSVAWDGSDAASGIYLYRLEAGNSNMTRKMILLK